VEQFFSCILAFVYLVLVSEDCRKVGVVVGEEEEGEWLVVDYFVRSRSLLSWW